MDTNNALASAQIANMTPEQYDEWVKTLSGSSEENKEIVEVKTEKTVYRYNSDTYEYIGTYQLQPNPVSPGSFLYPPNITEVPPLNSDTTKRIFWNPDTESWYYKEQIVGFDWYDKKDGYKGFDVNENNVSQYVRTIPPVEGISKWNEDQNSWEYDYELIKTRILQQVEIIKTNVMSEPQKTTYGVFNKITDILPIVQEYISLLSDGIIDEATLRDYDNKNVVFTLDDLKLLYSELIQNRETILSEYWEVKDNIKSASIVELEKRFSINNIIQTEDGAKTTKSVSRYDDKNLLKSVLDSLTKHI